MGDRMLLPGVHLWKVFEAWRRLRLPTILFFFSRASNTHGEQGQRQGKASSLVSPSGVGVLCDSVFALPGLAHLLLFSTP